MIVVYHLHRAYCRVNLANAALLQHYLMVAYPADDKILMVMTFGRGIVKQRTELRQLLVHRDYYS